MKNGGLVSENPINLNTLLSSLAKYVNFQNYFYPSPRYRFTIHTHAPSPQKLQTDVHLGARSCIK